MPIVSVNSRKKGAAGFSLVLAAGLLWALISPISKLLVKDNADFATVTLLRQAVPAAAFGVWLFAFRRDSLKITWKDLGVLTVFTLFGTMPVYFGFMIALATLSVPMGLVIHYTFPLMTALGSALFLKERPGKLEWFGGGLTVLGLLVSSGFDLSRLSLSGVLWDLSSAVGMAVQSLFGRKICKGSRLSPKALLFYSNAIGFVLTFIGRWIFMGAPYEIMSPRSLGLGLFLGVVASTFAYWLFFESMRYITASAATLGVTVEIAAAVVLTGVLAKEFPSAKEVLGCSLVIGAVTLGAFGSRPKQPLPERSDSVE